MRNLVRKAKSFFLDVDSSKNNEQLVNNIMDAVLTLPAPRKTNWYQTRHLQNSSQLHRLYWKSGLTQSRVIPWKHITCCTAVSWPCRHWKTYERIERFKQKRLWVGWHPARKDWHSVGLRTRFEKTASGGLKALDFGWIRKSCSSAPLKVQHLLILLG